MSGARQAIRLRPYKPTDRQFVERGLNLILAEKASLAPDHEIRPSPNWGHSYASFLLSHVHGASKVAIVAQVGESRAGFAFAAADSGIPIWMRRSAAFSRRCTVLEVHVEPSFRQTSVGPRLVQEIERRFARRGYDWITASYHRGHRFEAKLYRRCGYRANSVGVAKWLPGRRGLPR